MEARALCVCVREREREKEKERESVCMCVRPLQGGSTLKLWVCRQLRPERRGKD